MNGSWCHRGCTTSSDGTDIWGGHSLLSHAPFSCCPPYALLNMHSSACRLSRLGVDLTSGSCILTGNMLEISEVELISLLTRRRTFLWLWVEFCPWLKVLLWPLGREGLQLQWETSQPPGFTLQPMLGPHGIWPNGIGLVALTLCWVWFFIIFFLSPSTTHSKIQTWLWYGKELMTVKLKSELKTWSCTWRTLN